LHPGEGPPDRFERVPQTERVGAELESVFLKGGELALGLAESEFDRVGSHSSEPSRAGRRSSSKLGT
jgi:hypothetical protein